MAPTVWDERAMTILYTDPLFLRHETGAHPERPERLRAITARLEAAGLPERCQAGTYKPLAQEEVTALHAPALVRRAHDVAASGGGRLDPDTILSEESFGVALAAAGACCAAVDAVLGGQDRTALCLVRPPGHHATPIRSMGFCLFNNVALAAQRARVVHQINRALIIDFDVHHGNGTQDVFWEDGAVTFFSIHRYGMGFYPGTGAAGETGSGAGLGHIVNAPIRYGTPRARYRDAFLRGLENAANRSRPELVIVSAGFDAHQADPVGSLGLEVEDFAWLTREVLAVAGAHAGGRVVSCLEGGYDLQALAESTQAHLEELLAAPGQ